MIWALLCLAVLVAGSVVAGYLAGRSRGRTDGTKETFDAIHEAQQVGEDIDRLDDAAVRERLLRKFSRP